MCKIINYLINNCGVVRAALSVCLCYPSSTGPSSEQVQTQDFRNLDFIQRLDTDIYVCLKTISFLDISLEKVVFFVDACTPTETSQKQGRQDFFHHNSRANHCQESVLKCGVVGKEEQPSIKQ